MLQSELEDHIKNWQEGEVRIYRYRMGFYEPHVVTFRRESDDEFTLVKDYSTYKEYPTKNKENIEKEIASGRLVFYETYRGWGGFDPVRLRTGGCTCGAFLLSDKNNHYSDCYLYRRD